MCPIVSKNFEKWHLSKRQRSTGWHQCPAIGFDSFCHHTLFVTKHLGFLLSQSPSVDFTASSLFPFLCYSVARPRTSPQQTSSAEFTVSYKTGLWTDFQCSSVKYVNRIDNHRGTSTYQDPSFKTIRNVPLFLGKKRPWHIFRFPIILYNFQLKSVL